MDGEQARNETYIPKDSLEASLRYLSIDLLVGLNPRTRHLLERAGVLTIGDAIRKSDSELSSIFSYEIVCFDNLKEKLDSFLNGLLPAGNCA